MSSSQVAVSRKEQTAPAGQGTPVDALLTIICLIIAGCLAASFIGLRAGFSELHQTACLSALALAGAILGLPSMIRLITRRQQLEAPATLLGTGIVIALGCFIESGLTPILLSSFALASLACVIFECRNLTTSQRAILLAGSLLLGLWLSAYVFGRHARDPLITELTYVHKNTCDAFFHAVLADNLKTYGLTSTGVDGTPPFSYHVLSHWLFTNVSSFLNQSPLTFYLITYPIAFIPLFIKAFLAAASDFRSLLFKRWEAEDITSVAFWTVLSVSLIGCFPIAFYPIAGLSWGHPYTSESHLLALTLLFLTFSTVTLLYQAGGIARYSIILVLPALLMAMTGIKVVWYAIAPVAFAVLFVRAKAFRRPPLLIAVPLAVIGAYLINKLSKADECQGGIKFSPWDIFNYLPAGHQAEFVVFYLLPIWLLAIGTLIVYGRKATLSLTCAQTIACHLSLALLAVFFAISNLIELKAAAGLWFLDPIRWISLCAILGWVARDSFQAIPQTAFKSAATVALLLVAITTGGETWAAITRNLDERGKIVALNPAVAGDLYSGPQRVLDTLASYQFMTYLQELRGIPREYRKQTLIMIPQTCAPFWDKPAQPDPDWAVRHDRYLPFLPNALSAMASLDGMPPRERTAEAYGYDAYAKRDPGSEQKVEKGALLTAAKAKGYSRVLVVDWRNGAVQESLYVQSQKNK